MLRRNHSPRSGHYDALCEFDQLRVLVFLSRMSDLLPAPRRAQLNRLKTKSNSRGLLAFGCRRLANLARIPAITPLRILRPNLRSNGAINGATPTRTDTGRRWGFLFGSSRFIILCGAEPHSTPACHQMAMALPPVWGDPFAFQNRSLRSHVLSKRNIVSAPASLGDATPPKPATAF